MDLQSFYAYFLFPGSDVIFQTQTPKALSALKKKKKLHYEFMSFLLESGFKCGKLQKTDWMDGYINISPYICFKHLSRF